MDDRELAIQNLAQELEDNHLGCSHAQYSLSDWQQEVAEGTTFQGYWLWVAEQVFYDRVEPETI